MTIKLDELIQNLRGELVRQAIGQADLAAGGRAGRLAVYPADVADLQNFLRQCPANIPVMALGAGSNTLIRDGGVEGVVIHLGKHLNTMP